ncbi:protein LYRIC isoform X8 [Pan paniscus]|uniref:protein LYRIC isoform X8 n=1 Tax=Pan paniscus TaxID=9597 RepID=UPI001560F3FC|nr:protein LYRIC isoform X8 [Pan paniscus]XP_054512889.1 protein LYRIC isoform X8 [Pan troglodytes]
MAARSWQDELAQQAEEGSARLREMLSVGLGFLRTELGLDLGLEPKRYPGWVILVGTGALGLLLLFLLGYGWAAACAGARKKRRNPPRKREEAAAVPAAAPDDLALLKNLRSEEQKKKNRKKLSEKPKPNGRTVEVAEGEAVRTPQSVTAKQPPEIDKKNEKSKKNKKKSKSDAKAVQNSSRHDGKEVDEVSSGLNENLTVNGGGWNEKSVKLSSQISAGEEKWNSVSPASAGKRKTEPSAWSQDTGDANTNGKDWGRSWSDRSIFSGIAAWSSVDRGMNTSEQNSASFASLTLNSAVSGSTAEPVSQSTTSDYQWDVSRNQPYIDDEWSGLNGLSSADPNSDWNAPAEEWGNWVDEERASLLKSQEPIPDDQKVSDDDKEKGEGALPTGKSKKKKKKKKKQGEDNSTAQDTEELEKEIREELPMNTSKTRPKQEKAFSLKTISTSDPAEVLVKNSQPIKTLPPATSTEPSVILSKSDSDKSSSQVPPILQETDKSKSNTKQNSVPPSQTKSETSWESPKQIKKKKKARRET